MQSTPPPNSRKSKRQLLAETLQRFGLPGALRPLHDRGRRPLIVLGYHRIQDLHQPRSQPLDPDLVSATPVEFAWQMQHLRQNHEVVSLEQVVQHLDGGTALPRRAVAVTFDDGFTDTYHTAFPILREYGIPAALFVTTDYLGSGDVFWFERVAQIVMTVPVRWLQLGDERLPVQDDEAARHADLRRVLAVLKRMPKARREELVSGWTAGHPDPGQLSPTDDTRSIDWSQLLTLAASGISIGSHTVSHPNLALLNAEERLQELVESRQRLTAALSRRVDTVAYPIGTEDAFNSEVAASAREAGYQLGLTYLRGVNWQGSFDRLALKRLSIGPHITREWFRAMLTLPEWCAG